MTPNCQRLTSYGYRKTAGLLNFEKIWTDPTFGHKSRFWRNFAMTSPETLYTKNAFNEYSFLLVTHMAYFDTRFGLCRLLKSG
jgi:hypothetical protein